VEFRCRLASANGEIIEGVYSAESESRLRQELEEKGLLVLALQNKGAIAGISVRLPHRRSINTRDFLVFNQELATLLRAGMPLVQSLDLLRRQPIARSWSSRKRTTLSTSADRTYRPAARAGSSANNSCSN